jgi:polyisoprenoid-binding protein YceI
MRMRKLPQNTPIYRGVLAQPRQIAKPKAMMMRISTLLVALFLAACVTPTTDPTRLPAGQWELDPAHASATWQVRHMGLSWYTGRFDRLEASLEFDPQNPQDAQLVAIIDAASISTGDTRFDAELAQNWLHADRHPQLVFRSGQIDVIDSTHGRATGSLRINGIENTAVMEIEFYGGALNPLAGTRMLGFSADMQILRDDFNISNLPHAIVGNQINIHIEAEFLRRGDIND